MNDSKDRMNRNIWCILGLPFDAITLSDTVDVLRLSATNNTPLFLTTPNLNFLITSQNDNDFKDTVLNSDLSIADGKYIVWIARLLGAPIPERVAGSDLIELLIEDKDKPLKVFFFGGQDGVAEIACNKLKKDNTGLECAGFLNPGFGSIDDMSEISIIDEINRAKADFVIVSLGAKKGQAWIERNREYLNTPIISHLGAVVNFIAGNVNRAPKSWQHWGFEWLWRIKEEPSLWKRYFNDGISFLRLVLFNVIPLYILIRRSCPKPSQRIGNIESTTSNSKFTINLNGYFGAENISLVNQLYTDILDKNGDVELIISDSSYIDAAFIAKTMLFKSSLDMSNRNITIQTDSTIIIRILRYNRCEYLLN